MSLSAQATEARALIARSDLLFVDTQILRYVTGLYHQQELPPATVLELMQADQLQMISLSDQEIVKYRLTDEAFKAATSRRPTKKRSKKFDWLHHVLVATSGVSNPGALLDDLDANYALFVPFNTGLISKLMNATNQALDTYRKNPLLIGMTMRSSGYLVPLKNETASPSTGSRDLFPAYESVTINIIIDIEHNTYTFSTYAHGLLLSGLGEPIPSVIDKAMYGLGEAATKSTERAASKLLRDPQFDRVVSRRDIENPEVVEAIIAPADPEESEAE